MSFMHFPMSGMALDPRNDAAAVNSSMLRRNYRKTAFSEAEKTVILAKVEEFRAIIASRFNDNTSNRQKQQKWEEIALECSRVFPFHHRTGLEVKKKWENMITDAKRKLSILENPPDGRPPGNLPQLNIGDQKIIAILRSICQGYQVVVDGSVANTSANGDVFTFVEPKQENPDELNFNTTQPTDLGSPCSSGSFNQAGENVDNSHQLGYPADQIANQQGFSAVDQFVSHVHHIGSDSDDLRDNSQRFSLARECELLELEVMNLRRDKLRLEREKLRLEKAKLELDIARLKAEQHGPDSPQL